MKKFPAAVCVSFALAVLSGCNAFSSGDKPKTPEVKIDTIEVKDRQAVSSEGRVIGDTLLEGLKTNNYDLVKDLPIGDGKNTFTKEKFDMWQQRIASRGGIASYSYLGDLNMKPYHRLLWKISFTDQPGKKGNGVDVIFEMIVVRLDGKTRVARFGVRP